MGKFAETGSRKNHLSFIDIECLSCTQTKLSPSHLTFRKQLRLMLMQFPSVLLLQLIVGSGLEWSSATGQFGSTITVWR